MYSNLKHIIILLSIALGSFVPTLYADGGIKQYYRLNSSQIISFFSNKTLHSRNVRTKTTVLTYLSPDGTMKQSIKSSNIQRRGRWHAADDSLCLAWQQSDDDYCFDQVLFHGELFFLVKDRKLETIVHTGDDGDTTGF